MTETFQQANEPLPAPGFGERVAIVFATGFGLGRSPFAPGTVGSIPGVLLAAALAPVAWYWQAGAAAVLTVLAVPLCSIAERRFGTKDDHRIVADEYLTFPICVIGIPWVAHPWLLAVAFVVNRLLDIVKPPPARQLQAVPGGAGIVLDDFFSSLYALGVMHVLVRWVVLS